MNEGMKNIFERIHDSDNEKKDLGRLNQAPRIDLSEHSSNLINTINDIRQFEIDELKKRIEELEKREGAFAEWISQNSWYYRSYIKKWIKTTHNYSIKTTSELLKEYEEYLKTLDK